MKKLPNVFIAVLAKQKELVLPFFLKTLENLDYPKNNIFLYVRTNNNTDNTESILKNWLNVNSNKYMGINFDSSNVDVPVEKYDIHEWNKERFTVLGKIRQDSINAAIDSNCDFYFVIDVDNFIFPNTLKKLIELDQPIVAPLLRYAIASKDMPDPQGAQDLGPTGARYYSNYHYQVDDFGWFIAHDLYYKVLYREVKGLIECPCVHCTYLIKKEYLSKLKYLDDTERYEYMVFSKSAMANGIKQYLDNRQVYGVLTLTENVEASKWWYNNLIDIKTQDERLKELNK
jgi:hypothetical protein